MDWLLIIAYYLDMQEKDHLHQLHAFSANEAAFQHSFGTWRQKVFLPLLKILDRANVSPDALSLLGILVMILLPLGFLYSPVFLILAYLLHLFLDGIDGALARHKGIASQRGAYLDVVVDHASLVATVLTLQWFGLGGGFWLLLYSICYLILVVHFVLMNARGNPPTFPVIRTKYPLFLLTVLIGFGLMQTIWLEWFLMVFALYYAAMVVVYLVLFRWSLPS